MKMKWKGFILKSRLWFDNGGFGMNELLGIAAALIIAGLIIIPGFRKFAGDMMKGLTRWWNNTISDTIFPTS